MTTPVLIRSLFALDIGRHIEEVIKVDQTDEEILKDEINEYVVTDAIRSHYVEIFEAYRDTPTKPHEGIAIWVSGFFGSGKSSFAKMLGLSIENRTVVGESASNRFAKRTGDTKLQVLLKAITEKIPTHAVIFDVSTDRGIRSGNQTLTEIMYGLFLQSLGYAKDLDRSLFPGIQGGPLMHIIAAKAVCLKEAMEPGFVEYQHQIIRNAQRLAAGLSSAGFRLVSGGTDNHLMLVDVFSKGLTGKVAEAALEKAGITVNKNAIPFDQNPPMVASGIRIGTPAITSRGMREPEMDAVAGLIARVLASPDDDGALAAVRAEVEGLCRKFPLYPEQKI